MTGRKQGESSMTLDCQRLFVYDPAYTGDKNKEKNGFRSNLKASVSKGECNGLGKKNYGMREDISEVKIYWGLLPKIRKNVI